MSSSNAEAIEDLREQLFVLREDHEALQSEVTRLRRALAGLRAGPSSTPERRSQSEEFETESRNSLRRSPGADSRDLRAASEEESNRSYSLISEVRGESAATLRSPASLSSVAPSQRITWEEREQICDEIAQWVQRCLAGGHRGGSGRDRNPVASRYWLVFQDYQSLRYNPPLCFGRWCSAKTLVKRGQDTGPSIFVGLPSERECVRVVTGVGLQWSGVIQG